MEYLPALRAGACLCGIWVEVLPRRGLHSTTYLCVVGLAVMREAMDFAGVEMMRLFCRSVVLGRL